MVTCAPLLSILFLSPFTFTHTDTQTSICGTSFSIKTNTHTHSHTAVSKHTLSGCKCRCGEMKAAVVLWFHQVCCIYLTLSGVYCSSLTHTLIIPSPFWFEVPQVHRGRGPKGVPWGHIQWGSYFSPLNRWIDFAEIHIYGNRFEKSRRRTVLHIHTHN